MDDDFIDQGGNDEEDRGYNEYDEPPGEEEDDDLDRAEKRLRREMKKNSTSILLCDYSYAYM